MRHLQSSDGKQSGEQVYLTCKAKAFHLYGGFVNGDEGRDGQSVSSEGVAVEKADGSRFNILSNLLRDLNKDLKKEVASFPSSSTPLPSSFPIDRLLELGDTRELSFMPTIGIDVNYSKYETEPEEEVLTKPKFLKKTTVGRSELVQASKSAWETSSQDANPGEGDVDEDWYRPAELDVPIRVEDFDTFGNNCRMSPRAVSHREDSDLLGEEAEGSHNSISHHPTHTSSSSGTVQASTARRSEETVRRTLKRIVCRMAGGLYGEVNTEDLLKQLDGFLESTHKQSTFSKGM